MFHVGQKVTLIRRSSFGDLDKSEVEPQFGVVYTVRDIVELFGGVWLTLAEIRNPPIYTSGQECHFDADEFRPIVERKTDISIFTALLNPSPQKVRESIGYDLGFTAEEIGLS